MSHTDVLKSNLCNYKRGVVTVAVKVTHVALKSWTPFSKCITKIDGTAIDDAEDLDSVIAMYNLLE